MILVLVTCPSTDVAASLARSLVEEQLAACGNIVPGVRSIYRWEGAVHDEAEVLLVLKTRQRLFERLRARVIESHPYDVPEVVAVAADAVHAPYLAWVLASTQAEPGSRPDQVEGGGREHGAPDPALVIRPGAPVDADAVARLLVDLWPEGTLAEHRAEAAAILSGSPPSTTPLVLFVAELHGAVIGVVEVGLRSHADGCDPMHPVGFVEGWYVEPERRRRGVGEALLRAAEEWARAMGCHELASDTWVDDAAARQAHLALGFQIVDRCVTFKKTL